MRVYCTIPTTVFTAVNYLDSSASRTFQYPFFKSATEYHRFFANHSKTAPVSSVGKTSPTVTAFTALMTAVTRQPPGVPFRNAFVRTMTFDVPRGDTDGLKIPRSNSFLSRPLPLSFPTGSSGMQLD
jgi:hypothetical protein